MIRGVLRELGDQRAVVLNGGLAERTGGGAGDRAEVAADAGVTPAAGVTVPAFHAVVHEFGPFGDGPSDSPAGFFRVVSPP